MDKTIAKGFLVLEALADSPSPRGVADLSRQLGLSKSNIHRTLQTLAALGYVSGTDGRYAPTLKLWSIGSKMLEGLDFKKVAAPSLSKLVDVSGESVHLSIYDHGQVVYIDKVESLQPVRAYTHIGSRAPAYCVATGKVLLAFQREAEIERVLGELEPHSLKTIVSPEAMRATLVEIRARDYAVNRGEWRKEVSGVASPVRDGYNEVVAAVGISGPTERFTEDALATFVPKVRDIAWEISLALGATKGGRHLS